MKIPLRRIGFTLAELVIAILIVGILSAVAVPKLITQARLTNDHAHRAQLMILRDAIERYIVENDHDFPPSSSESEFKNALANYLRGDFPGVELAGATTADVFDPYGVRIVDTGGGQLIASTVTTKGWVYDAATGIIKINLKDSTYINAKVRYIDW